jgi:hypothetical protein
MTKIFCKEKWPGWNEICDVFDSGTNGHEQTVEKIGEGGWEPITERFVASSKLSLDKAIVEGLQWGTGFPAHQHR